MPENEDFSGKTSTQRLDTWVFDKVTDFLHRDGQKVAEKERSIFFLHLLGLDTGTNLDFNWNEHFIFFPFSTIEYYHSFIHRQLDMFISRTPSKFWNGLDTSLHFRFEMSIWFLFHFFHQHSNFQSIRWKSQGSRFGCIESVCIVQHTISGWKNGIHLHGRSWDVK